MGHGRSKAFVDALPADFDGKIVDLSNDYRLNENAEGFVYGLPECNKEDIESSNKIAIV